MVPPDEDSLRHLLGPADELPGGPDELRGIVARAGRRWRRTAAAGMALTLAAGAGAGYLVARQSSPAPTTVAVGAASSSTTVARSQVAAAPGAAGGAVPGAAGGAVPGGGALAYPWPPGQAGPPSYTLLFVRSSGPVAVRGFLTNFPQPAGVPAPCGWLGGPAFVADVSTAKMVGQAFAGFGTSDRSKPISADSVSVLGQAEADPTLVVVVATGSGVATVRVAFAGGATDQTAPVKGWVALASQVGSALALPTARLGTLSALDAAGRVIATQTVTLADGQPGMGAPLASSGPPCVMAPCPVPEPATTLAPGAHPGAPATPVPTAPGISHSSPPATAPPSTAPPATVPACAAPCPAPAPAPGAPTGNTTTTAWRGPSAGSSVACSSSATAIASPAPVKPVK